MVAEPSNAATPKPTTPNRWRQRASRLFRWFLPGLIATTATAAVGLVIVRIWDPRSYLEVNAEEQPLKFLMHGFNHPLTKTEESLADVELMESKYAPFVSQRGILFFENTPPPAWVRAVNPPFTDLDPPPGVLAVRPDRYAWVERSGVSHRVMSIAVWHGVGFPLPILSRTRWVISTNTVVRGFMPQLFGSPVEVPYPDNGTHLKASTWLRSTFLTWIPEPVGFLLNTVLLSTLWMPITAWHRRRKAKHTNCKRCGYSREGLAPDTVCPECGQKPVH